MASTMPVPPQDKDALTMITDQQPPRPRNRRFARVAIASMAAVSLLGLSGCVTDPNTGERKISRAAIGGTGGAGLGYLLGGLRVDRPGQVWCADITYLPMRRGFLYLVAVMDWATRKVLAWRVSNTLEVEFCLEALEEALEPFDRAFAR